VSDFCEQSGRDALQKLALNFTTAFAFFAGVVVGFFLSLIAVLKIAALTDQNWNRDEKSHRDPRKGAREKPRFLPKRGRR
jgi:hypothetical protein